MCDDLKCQFDLSHLSNSIFYCNRAKPKSQKAAMNGNSNQSSKLILDSIHHYDHLGEILVRVDVLKRKHGCADRRLVLV